MRWDGEGGESAPTSRSLPQEYIEGEVRLHFGRGRRIRGSESMRFGAILRVLVPPRGQDVRESAQRKGVPKI